MPMLYVVLAVAALATAAVVAAPLRRATPKLFAAVVLVVPVLAFALYRIVGTPAALDPALAAASAQADAPTMEEAIAELEAALRRDPAQPEGWRLLARAYAAQGERAKSRDAFMRALEQIPDDPELLIEAAQVRAQAAPGNQFDDEALAQLRRALALDPGNQRAKDGGGVAPRRPSRKKAAKPAAEAAPEVPPEAAPELAPELAPALAPEAAEPVEPMVERAAEPVAETAAAPEPAPPQEAPKPAAEPPMPMAAPELPVEQPASAEAPAQLLFKDLL